MLTIPGYDDLTEIGTGGFAVVYRARASAFNRDVAVKVLSRHELDGRAVRLFERERAAMGTLSAHPNIVTIYDAGLADGGIPYLVMEYLPGGSLGDRLERDGALPWEEALSIGIKLAGALEAAHRAGLLHRDVKPENVFVSAYGEPELGDFGIVRTVDLTDTRTNDRSLSVPYAAPEIVNGADPSVFSDVYSLGATIYALVAGAPPFHRDGEASVIPHLARIANEPPPDLRSRGVPGLLCRALERAMAKSPSDRPQSAVELAESLQHVQRRLGRPITPIPVRVVGDAPAPLPEPVASHAPPTAPAPPSPSPAIPAPSRRRRWPLGVAAGVVALATMAATAVAVRDGGEDDNETPVVAQGPATTLATVAGVTATRPLQAFVPLPDEPGVLPSSLYRTDTFTPRLRFALSAGWYLASEERTDLLDLARGQRGPYFSMVAVDDVVEATRSYTDENAIDAAARQRVPDLVAWLTSHPRLKTRRTERDLGGVAVTQVDVTVADGYRFANCEASCVALFPLDGGHAFYASSRSTTRIYVFEIGGRPMVGVAEAPAHQFTALATEAERVLASVQPA